MADEGAVDLPPVTTTARNRELPETGCCNKRESLDAASAKVAFSRAPSEKAAARRAATCCDAGATSAPAAAEELTSSHTTHPAPVALPRTAVTPDAFGVSVPSGAYESPAGRSMRALTDTRVDAMPRSRETPTAMPAATLPGVTLDGPPDAESARSILDASVSLETRPSNVSAAVDAPSEMATSVVSCPGASVTEGEGDIDAVNDGVDELLGVDVTDREALGIPDSDWLAERLGDAVREAEGAWLFVQDGVRVGEAA